MCSLELRAGVDVALEGAVVDICAVIVEVWEDGLVHGTVPLNVPRKSMAVPVHILVILVIDGSLASSPLSVRIGHGRVLGEDAARRPVEQVWVVHQSLGVERVVIENDGSVGAETTANTPNDEIADPAISQPASRIETLDGELTDDGETQKDAKLGS